MRKLIAGVALGAALVFSGSAVAFADDIEVSPAPSQTMDYTPDNPTTPSLAGSIAVGDCERDAPWINYSVELTDPEGIHSSETAVLILSNGSQTEQFTLGELVDNKLSGRILWPGASVDSRGVANGWPGWTQSADGTWTETDGNYRWTRGDISAVIHVNPEVAVSLAYPKATADCFAGPRGAAQSAAFLPATGMNAAVLPLAIGGGVVVLAGIAFLVIQRRRRANA